MIENINIEEIQDYLPHRYPFLLVDRVIKLELGNPCEGKPISKHIYEQLLQIFVDGLKYLYGDGNFIKKFSKIINNLELKYKEKEFVIR